MKIWVDADGCPNSIKEILFRSAKRTEIHTQFIANHYINIPTSKFIQFTQVPKGFDVADNEIVKRVNTEDLVITSDIPLASETISKGAIALNFRSQLYTKENIKARLDMRNFMETLRNSGVETGGPPPFSQKDRHQFAAQLDKILLRKG